MDTITQIKALYEETKGESVPTISIEEGQVVKVEYQVKKFVHPVSCSQIDAQIISVTGTKDGLEKLKAEVAAKEAELSAGKDAVAVEAPQEQPV